MKKLSGLLMLLVLLFSVTTMLTAADFESVNSVNFSQGTIETTISQNMGGIVYQAMIDERLAVSVESIMHSEYNPADMVLLYGASCKYNDWEHGKWFIHPAVLGIV